MTVIHGILIGLAIGCFIVWLQNQPGRHSDIMNKKNKKK
jgi:hypothetical protein